MSWTFWRREKIQLPPEGTYQVKVTRLESLGVRPLVFFTIFNGKHKGWRGKLNVVRATSPLIEVGTFLTLLRFPNGVKQWIKEGGPVWKIK